MIRVREVAWPIANARMRFRQVVRNAKARGMSFMSAVSFPVTRPVGRALLVGTAACRAEPAKLLREQGYDCAEAEDPYAAMILLARQRQSFRTIVLSLASLYR